MKNIATTPGVSGTTARPTPQKPKDRESSNDGFPTQPSAVHVTSTTSDCVSSEPAPFNSSSPAASPSPVVEVVKTGKQLKREAQARHREEELKRQRRERISKEVGHEVDTDGEREYDQARWEKFKAILKVEEDRREALSPEARRQEDIDKAARTFRSQIKPLIEVSYSGSVQLEHYPLFLLQSAPDSHNGATCGFGLCTDRIILGEYRIAVTCVGRWEQTYHVRCFEELLELSSAHYMARFEPDRQKHTPDEGAKAILEEYLRRWKSRLGKGNNGGDPQEFIAEVSSKDELSPIAKSTTWKEEQQLPRQEIPTDAKVPEANNVTLNESRPISTSFASSIPPSYGIKQIEKLNRWAIGDEIWEGIRQANASAIQEQEAAVREYEAFFDHSGTLRNRNINVSTSESEDQAWCISKYIPKENEAGYNERHALSQALESWNRDSKLACLKMDELSEAERAAKETLGEQTLAEIKRLQAFQMPGGYPHFGYRRSVRHKLVWRLKAEAE